MVCTATLAQLAACFFAKEKLIHTIPLLTSVALFAVVLVLTFIRQTHIKNKNIVSNRLMIISGVMLGSVLCLRFAVGMYMNLYPEADHIPLNKFEEICNSFVHALQTFSMDEEYTLYLQKGKMMIRMLQDTTQITGLERIFVVYSSAVSVVAPVVGGALLLDILANLLPGFRLWLANGQVWRQKYYFNELNDRSILLAESLQKLKDGNPIIVFARAGRDTSQDLLNAAKKLDAICLEADLEHIRKCKIGKRSYFLISEDENANLRTLAGMAQQSCGGYLTKSLIYLFTSDDAYIQLENKMYENLIRWGMPQDKLPLLYPVRTAHNMISDLLKDVPLYEPLIHKAKQEKLTLQLTVLGCGTYGMEMLLSSYSFGQMLDVHMNITVVSKEEEREFYDKLYAASPEFRATTKIGDPILHYDHQGHANPPYCSIDYIQCDVRSEKFLKLLQGTVEDKTLKNTDYFLISLGDDSRNIAAAELVTRHIGTYHLEDPDARTVIACVVTDGDMDRLLGEQHSVDESIYLHVIGGTHEVYSVNNVFRLSHAREGNSKHAKYTLYNRAEQLKKQTKRHGDAYSFYSSIATTMHRKYRIFALSRLLRDPLIKESVFTTEGHKSARYIKQEEQANSRYLQFLGSNGATEKAQEQFDRIMHRLAWMEHRRWNAYIRASGFRHTDRYMQYVKRTGSHKNMKLKLHPCLVESSDSGILAKIMAQGKIDPHSLLLPSVDAEKEPLQKYPSMQAWMQAYGRSEVDLLDELSFELFDKDINGYDFKRYDYPNDHLDTNGNLLPEACSDLAIEIEDSKKPEEQPADKPADKTDEKQESKDSKPPEKTKKQLRLEKRKEKVSKALRHLLKKPVFVVNLEELWSTRARKGGKLEYHPAPLSTARTKLPEGWAAIQPVAARAIHEAWLAERKHDGWTHGSERDDGLQKNPCMVEFDALSPEDRAYDMATADETMRSIIALGYIVGPKPQEAATEENLLKELEEKIAESIHERWAAGRMAEGWTWGDLRDDAQKKTPCLIPFASLPAMEKKYDCLTARSALKVITKHYLITEVKQS